MKTAPERWLDLMPTEAVREQYRGLRAVHGSDWLAATDGYQMIAQRDGIPLSGAADALPSVVAEWFLPIGPALGTRTVERLRAWAGPAEWPERRWLDAVPAEQERYTCEYPEPRPVELGGSQFDLTLIAQLAAALPDDASVTLYVDPHGPKLQRLVGCCGDDIRIVLMCLGDTDTSTEESR